MWWNKKETELCKRADLDDDYEVFRNRDKRLDELHQMDMRLKRVELLAQNAADDVNDRVVKAGNYYISMGIKREGFFGPFLLTYEARPSVSDKPTLIIDTRQIEVARAMVEMHDIKHKPKTEKRGKK